MIVNLTMGLFLLVLVAAVMYAIAYCIAAMHGDLKKEKQADPTLEALNRLCEDIEELKAMVKLKKGDQNEGQSK